MPKIKSDVSVVFERIQKGIKTGHPEWRVPTIKHGWLTTVESDGQYTSTLSIDAKAWGGHTKNMVKTVSVQEIDKVIQAYYSPNAVPAEVLSDPEVRKVFAERECLLSFEKTISPPAVQSGAALAEDAGK